MSRNCLRNKLIVNLFKLKLLKKQLSFFLYAYDTLDKYTTSNKKYFLFGISLKISKNHLKYQNKFLILKHLNY